MTRIVDPGGPNDASTARILTAAQTHDATPAELIATVRAIASHLDGVEEADVLRTARDVLAAHGIERGLRITIGVDEWDDGYFYSGVVEVTDDRGIEVALSSLTLCALEAALEEPELSRSGRSVGRFAQCIIDVDEWTVRR